MFTVNIAQLAPKFLLRDRNGRAMAKAIEAAMQSMNDVIDRGVKCITDVNAMPEWRLDELAWEYDILYDDAAELGVKREWIADALGFYALYGTAAGIAKHLKAAFSAAVIEEWFNYGGDPFHFRVTVSGEWSEANNDWAYETIERVKNARSVLDTITFNATNSTAAAAVGAAVTDIEILARSYEEESL